MAKIKAGAHTARQITVNHGDANFDIIPNGKDSAFVDVPDEVLKTPFVKALVDSGDLVVGSHEEDAPNEERQTLLRSAQEAGVKVDKRWSDERLQQEIDKAKAPK